MVTARQLVDLMRTQDGDAYIFGAEASPSDSDPTAFDCSELVQWACDRLGVVPRMVDGSWYQARHCKTHGTLIPVADAVDIPGALLFRFSSTPFSGARPTSAHVAVSQGNGLTIEARSRWHGVGEFPVDNRGWTHAGLVPGVDYVPISEEDIVTKLPELRRGDGFSGRANLRYHVRILQASLAVAGVVASSTFNAQHQPDGLFGPGTESAVKKYQTASGLPSTGVVSEATWKRLLNV